MHTSGIFLGIIDYCDSSYSSVGSDGGGGGVGGGGGGDGGGVGQLQNVGCGVFVYGLASFYHS